ncbi:MAG TPA: EthD domain-containing protein [Methylibium sp.]|nr:EthD domain-containing protein [Methylibium sp.]
MAPVTTVALLARKAGLAPELFSRYWRDVHGTLAARIPGFDSYVQYHLGAPWPLALPVAVADAARFDGFAEVGFRDDGDRAGLAGSEVAALIQADEQNVFRTTLLYNLAAGASRTLFERGATPQPPPASALLLLGRRPGTAHQALIDAIEQALLPALSAQPGVLRLRLHALASGDPSLWVTAGVDNRQTPDQAFDAILQVDGASVGGLAEAVQAGGAAAPASLYRVLGRLQGYPVAARYAMVQAGRPTHLGLRGWDVLQTITAAGARNQLGEAVTRCLYGIDAADA